MDLKKMFQKEHSKMQTSTIVSFVGSNENRFKVLVQVYLDGSFKITLMAAWALSICVENFPHLMGPHLKKILDHLERPNVHNAEKRNIMRLLQFIEIPTRYHGRVIDLCFRYLEDRELDVAIRVCSMTVLSHIIKHQPDLRRELIILLEDELPYGSPAFKSRAKKVLKDLLPGQ